MSCVEQEAVVIRYVDVDDNGMVTVHEDFIGFLQPEETTGKAIAELLLQFLWQMGLDPALMRAQGYDGASNMSGIHKGAKTVIQRSYPKAVYVHCRAHALNLVLVQSCENQYIRNMLGVVQKVTVFFRDSAKRHLKLSESIRDTENVAFKERSTLPLMSETRWSSRAVSLETFVGNYEGIQHALTDLSDSGDSTAHTLLASITTDDFVIALVVGDLLLGYINTLSKQFQAIDTNLLAACSEAENILQCLRDERSSTASFCLLIGKAEKMLGKPLELPRRTQ